MATAAALRANFASQKAAKRAHKAQLSQSSSQKPVPKLVTPAKDSSQQSQPLSQKGSVKRARTGKHAAASDQQGVFVVEDLADEGPTAAIGTAEDPADIVLGAIADTQVDLSGLGPSQQANTQADLSGLSPSQQAITRWLQTRPIRTKHSEAQREPSQQTLGDVQQAHTCLQLATAAVYQVSGGTVATPSTQGAEDLDMDDELERTERIVI